MHQRIVPLIAAALIATPLVGHAGAVIYDFTGYVAGVSPGSDVPEGSTVVGTYTFDLSNANPSQSSGIVGSTAGWTSESEGGKDFGSLPPALLFSTTVSGDGFSYSTQPPSTASELVISEVQARPYGSGIYQNQYTYQGQYYEVDEIHDSAESVLQVYSCYTACTGTLPLGNPAWLSNGLPVTLGEDTANYLNSYAQGDVPDGTTDVNYRIVSLRPAGTTDVSLEGGTLADPTPLESEGRIGLVEGSIGGAVAEDFYRFDWAGGLFEGNAQLYGSPEGEYQFDLYGLSGDLLDSINLDAADNFGADLALDLPGGTGYEIGLIAEGTSDPNFAITLMTPVSGGAVPEPAPLGLLAIGLAAMLLRPRRASAG